MGHDTEHAVSLAGFHERVFQQSKMPGVYSKFAVAVRGGCPKCGRRHVCLLSNGWYQCAECRRQTSVISGTVLHKTHMPLTQWFLAVYFVSQDKRGIFAVALMSTLGTTYKTAWYMLTRIRAAMDQ